jgi:hypothetical protein
VTNKKLTDEVTRLKLRMDALESIVVDMLRREALEKSVLERVGKVARKQPKPPKRTKTRRRR